MDTSKEYIKMCEKAEEIQKRWGAVKGDVYCFKGENYDSSSMGYIPYKQKAAVWLPRQDQLQEMVRNMPVDLPLSAIGWIGKFYQWCVDEMEHVTPMKNSMEQLWLAFVMKEKYNKVWTGKEWVKWTQENV